MAVSRLPKAVITITGMSGRLAASRVQNCRPSMPGIFRSVNTTSKSSRQKRSNAASAEVKQHGAKSRSRKSASQQVAHAPFVVDDQDSRLHELRSLRQMTVKQLPSPGRLATSIQPPCSWTMPVGDREAQPGAFAERPWS